MKLGIITDIHNNLPALKAVISALTEAECEKIICAGDIIGIGPYPEETVQYIKSIPNLIAVRGNHEGYLLDGMVKLHTDKCMDEEEIAYHKWEHSLLSKDSVDFLGTLPCRIDFIADGVNVSVIHYATNENGNYSFLIPDPTDDDLDYMFKDVGADVIIYGHDHKRSITRGKKLYVNVGALGCPAKDGNIARGGIIEITGGEASARAIDVVYDVESVVEEIDRLSYPARDTVKRLFYGIY